jgi:hypothetical protein
MVIVGMAPLIAPVRAKAAARAVAEACALHTRQSSMTDDAADERQLGIALFLMMMLDAVGSQCRRSNHETSSFRRAIG